MDLGKQLQMSRHHCWDQASADIRGDLDRLQEQVRIVGLVDHTDRDILGSTGSVQLRG